MTSLNLLTSKYLPTNIQIIVSTKNFILLIDFLVVFPVHSIGIASRKSMLNGSNLAFINDIDGYRGSVFKN